MVSRQQQRDGGNQSQTQLATEEQEEIERSLRLVGDGSTENGEASTSRARVAWTEDTIDNEHLNRKKSKICCIFHPNDELCESSEEEEYSSPSSSSSSSSSSSESDSSIGGTQGTRRSRHRHHRHGLPRPNAYERQPARRPQGRHAS